MNSWVFRYPRPSAVGSTKSPSCNLFLLLGNEKCEIILECSSAVEPTTVNRLVVGSIPTIPANFDTLRDWSRDNFILKRNRINEADLNLLYSVSSRKYSENADLLQLWVVCPSAR